MVRQFDNQMQSGFLLRNREAGVQLRSQCCTQQFATFAVKLTGFSDMRREMTKLKEFGKRCLHHQLAGALQVVQRDLERFNQRRRHDQVAELDTGIKNF